MFLLRATTLVTVSAMAIGVGLAAPRPAASQSLGEIARKEQERRKTVPPSTKVYTTKDLGKVPPPPPPQTSTAPDSQTIPIPDAPAAEQPAAADAPASGTPGTEAEWRAKINAAREELRRNEIFAEALQSRINALSRDFSARDNPVQRREIGETRAEALTELGRVKQEIDRGKKAIADVEEEARRAGVPPGWLR